jgi:hypothetical protein
MVLLQKVVTKGDEREGDRFSFHFGCHFKQASDEGDLTSDVSFDHPVHLGTIQSRVLAFNESDTTYLISSFTGN